MSEIEAVIFGIKNLFFVYLSFRLLIIKTRFNKFNSKINYHSNLLLVHIK